VAIALVIINCYAYVRYEPQAQGATSILDDPVHVPDFKFPSTPIITHNGVDYCERAYIDRKSHITKTKLVRLQAGGLTASGVEKGDTVHFSRSGAGTYTTKEVRDDLVVVRDDAP
jgi:hypothetical protein